MLEIQDLNFQDIHPEFKWEEMIGKTIAIYCADDDGEEDLYDFDQLEFAGILASDNFKENQLIK